MSCLNRSNITSVVSASQITRAMYFVYIPQGAIDILSKSTRVGSRGVGGVKSNLEHVDVAFASSMVEVGRSIEGIAEAYNVYPHVQFKTTLDMLNLIFNFKEFIRILFTRTNKNMLFSLSLDKDQLVTLRKIADFVNHLTEEHKEKMVMGLKKHYLKGEFKYNPPVPTKNKKEIAETIDLKFNYIDIDDMLYVRNEGTIEL